MIELYNKIAICSACASRVRTFRDRAAEAAHDPSHVVEQALAHAVRSAMEAAYRRGDL